MDGWREGTRVGGRVIKDRERERTERGRLSKPIPWTLKPCSPPPAAPHDRQVAVAATLISHTLAFRERLSSGSLPPDMVGGSKAQCSAMYAFLFNSCRIPGTPPRDRVATYPHSSSSSWHIVVVRKRRFVRVDAGGLTHAQVKRCVMDAYRRSSAPRTYP